MPIPISDDDPEMLAARRRARDTLGEMRLLHSQPNSGVRLKVPFVTSSGVRELLWAELRDLRAEDAQVLYLTPPVTHTGRLERLHVHPLWDVVDWQVELPDGRYRGGFTMRVMFARHREKYGQLPAGREAEEKRYLAEA